VSYRGGPTNSESYFSFISAAVLGENSDHSHEDTPRPYEAHAWSPGASSEILGLGSSLTIVIATDCG
jgi:hypothetical protein